VLAGAHAQLGKSAERFCLWFGAISYPLYVIHWPLLKIVKRALSRFDMSPSETIVIMALATALMVFVAHIVLKLCPSMSPLSPSRHTMCGIKMSAYGARAEVTDARLKRRE
jgi:peptidoglycan/LPS O-acetylase OafA/YrhL